MSLLRAKIIVSVFTLFFSSTILYGGESNSPIIEDNLSESLVNSSVSTIEPDQSLVFSSEGENPVSKVSLETQDNSPQVPVKKTFWQRHSKKIIVGAVVGVGLLIGIGILSYRFKWHKFFLNRPSKNNKKRNTESYEGTGFTEDEGSEGWVQSKPAKRPPPVKPERLSGAKAKQAQNSLF